MVTHPYLSAVAQLLEDAAAATGRGIGAASALPELAAAHGSLPEPVSWRCHSRLTRDGSPIELVETLGPEPSGLGFTIDPGPYGAPAEARLSAAAGLLERHWADARGFVSTLFPRAVPLGRFSLWLGWGEDGIKAYAELGGPAARGALQRALEALTALDLAPASATMGHLGVLLGAGHPKLLAMTIRDGRAIAAKLYVRLTGRTDLTAFEPYLRAAFDGKISADDPNLEIGLAWGANGRLHGTALYHYVGPYAADDASLRKAVLRLADRFGWSTEAYRITSRLIDAGPGVALRGLVGFALAADGTTRLKLYARTGHLARATAADRAA